MDRETHLEECHTYQTKCNIHEVYIITAYLENKAISGLLNNVWKYQNYALYVTE